MAKKPSPKQAAELTGTVRLHRVRFDAERPRRLEDVLLAHAHTLSVREQLRQPRTLAT